MTYTIYGWTLFLLLNPYYTDPAQPLLTAGDDIDHLDNPDHLR